MQELDAKERVKQILSTNQICMLATASLTGKPEVATMEYTEDDQFNLYFETFPKYRKYTNLKTNPYASVVINQLPHTIQMDGTATELTGAERENAKHQLTNKHGSKNQYQDPTICFFKFTPTWIRVLVEPKYPPKFVVLKGEGKKEAHELAR
ncbi:MAG: pyridoxamine 5'-phosphate oxidase family protein [Candidatus Woesearchaeota archaeon]|nr:pyridoxamine 5'-phosphate oxidase family protein [Candidatus Woesearchaeota archaeon]